MAELERAKRKRATNRSLMTRILNKAKEGLETDIQDTGLLGDLLVQLTDKEKTLQDLDKEIEDRIQDYDELETEIIGAQEYRERVLNMKRRLSEYLKRNTNPNAHRETAGTSTPVTTVRLPRLTINKFNGDIINWQNFWAQFNSSFHKNETLNKIDKFNYLKGFLEGPAANAIAGLMLTENNYDAAVKILTERFGKTSIVVSAHVNKLLSLSSVKRASDLGSLRMLYDACEIQIRSLESAGVQLKSYGSLLFPLLVKLIPDEINLEFNRKKKSEDEWDINELLDFLKSEIESRERTFLFSKIGCAEQNRPDSPSTSKYKHHNKFGYGGGANQRERATTAPSAAALSTVMHESCVICGQAHETQNCHEYTASERKNILKQKGKCFVCLKGHIMRFCRSRIRCERCHRRHNKVICEAAETNSVEPVKTEAMVSSVAQAFNPENVVLLQTASALARGRNRSMSLRLLIDSGSQRSFVSETMSRELDLPVIAEEILTVHAFGTQNPMSVKRRRVRLTLQNVRDVNIRIEIEALETPSISSALIHVPGKSIQDFCKENDMQLADCSQSVHKDMQIAVLIGADFYWQIVTGGMRRLSESLVALESKFGWLVHGPTAVATMFTGHSVVSVMKVATNNGESDAELASTQLRKFWELDSLGITD